MAHYTFFPLAFAVLGLTACAELTGKPGGPGTASAMPEAVQVAHDKAAADEKAAAEARAAMLPKQDLTPGMLFQFLVAEVAGQRGQISVSKSAYLDLARQTRDPRIAGRAAEIAVFARDPQSALEAAEIWIAAEPDSERALHTLSALRLGRGEADAAEPLLRKMLARDAASVFMSLPSLLARTQNPQAGFDLTRKLAAEYPLLPEAHFSVGQVGALAGNFEVALAALDQAARLRPDWQPMAQLRSQILARTSRSDALAYLKGFIAQYPDAHDVRLSYARLLVGANRVSEAKTEFARLAADFPKNSEVSFTAALLALQTGDAAAAESLLTQTLEYGAKDTDAVYYYLGLTAEELKQPERALEWHAKVGAGNYAVQARARQAALLARAGKLDEARALLAATEGRSDEERIRLSQAEAELLRDAKDHVGVYKVLTEALARYPDSTELLYDRAMSAEKIDRLDVLEADLRRLIELKPDHAQAYNALGYTLADRTNRLAEAVTLLDRALELTPDDPFVLDSAGWAQYRLGNFTRAQEFIERAYKARPDPEIAAHLGEVMWARGQRSEANELWQTSLQTDPQNELLLETIKRFPR